MKAFNKTPTDGRLTRVTALKCRPVKNVQVDEDRLDSGEVVLSYPTTMRPWFAGLVRRLGGPEAPTRMKKLQLDTLGTAVWDLMDGRRTVRQLVRDFAEAYQLHPREAEVSVTRFLRDLGKRGIIGLK